MKKRSLRKETIYILVFIIGILYISTFDVTSSRYLGQISSNSEVLAVPVISLNQTGATYDLTKMKPGDTKELEFIVTNKENEQINEVLLSYDLEFIINGNLPLNFKLFSEDGQEISLLNNKTSEQRLDFGLEASKKYRLQVIWNKEDNNLEYANVTGNLQINLRAIQVV